jgi:hypothetical protein
MSCSYSTDGARGFSLRPGPFLGPIATKKEEPNKNSRWPRGSSIDWIQLIGGDDNFQGMNKRKILF